ncbi:hypothetical protein LPJ53_006102 [Coemansia erecta]|uniref:RRM domain-containing protein n=1 Tax=Coemansia erecta TaxID=147472 RepID=A0A9W7XV85_9FUNG|nr:hypothetical protein LPJ53_006102 [Coemansia erecta]
MNNNLDRSLDDIINESNTRGRDGGHSYGRHGGRQHQNSGRNSPYNRNNTGSPRHQHQNAPRSHGQWKHDMFDGPKQMVDRVGSPRRNMEGRLGAQGDARKQQIQQQRQRNGGDGDDSIDQSSDRGIPIAGRNRDTVPYDQLRVVYVTGLPRNYTEEKIERMFSDIGRIDQIRMGIDMNERFIGKAEIVYRVADDARSAIQVFDGETLYGTDDMLLNKVEIRYSNPQNWEYLENIKYKDSLPTARNVPIGSRLSGMNSRNAMAAAAIYAAAAAAASAQQQQGMAGGPPRNQGHMGGRQRNQNQRHNGNDRRQQSVTAQQLDDDLDAYMRDSNSAETAKDAEPPATSAPE